MYRVLLVDDEPIVLQAIAALVPWSAHRTRLVGTADNGLAAYQQIAEDPPDIVICDIKMPGMDGLELMARVREEFPDVVFAVLSGYEEFHLARRAMELGVRHYLLKPCNEEEIGRMLDALVDRLDHRRAQQARVMDLEAELARAKARLSELEPDTSETEDDAERSERQGLVERVVAYVQKHLADPCINLTHLARHQFFVSPDYLGRLFRERTGLRFSDFLTMTRIQRAQDLWRGDPDLTVAEVAERVGFADHTQYFSQVFKKYTGDTPSGFKKRIRVAEEGCGGQEGGEDEHEPGGDRCPPHGGRLRTASVRVERWAARVVEL
ncbi:MAG: response regulator [Alicyclobacillus macrosporangiidus]|uniref:response regulator transcription factor n=1 Tax=Alicyclobacillus macrosporangiidus TaxID=392015 RepID=UPI0026F062FC|nr:response regulator [Alicyclobacillus macrosporangiidus]MCL6597198.1 response regulator [Alicyclobacillus macrosporangiidus]